MRIFTRCLVVLFVLSLAIWAQTLIVSTAEITCDTAAHAMGTSGIARWIQLVAPSTNAGNVRWGDSAVTASRGGIIAPGGGQLLPNTNALPGYDLTKIYYFCTSPDKLEIVYAK